MDVISTQVIPMILSTLVIVLVITRWQKVKRENPAGVKFFWLKLLGWLLAGFLFLAFSMMPHGAPFMIVTLIVGTLTWLAYKLWRKVMTGHQGWFRVGISLSVAWVAGWLAFTTLALRREDESISIFLLLGVAPVFVFWAAQWIASGFKK